MTEETMDIRRLRPIAGGSDAPITDAPPEPVVVTPPDDTPPQPEPEKPHPLEPGGERWNEVYRERSEYKRDNETLRAENERLRTQPPVAKPEAQKVWTGPELQALVDAGRIAPHQMAEQLAIQVGAATEQRIAHQFEQRSRADAARNDVNAYIAKVPALTNTASPEFQRVAAEAHRIAADIGLLVSDARVQRLALTAALGPIDKITSAQRARDFDRTHADTHAESGGGGGHRASTTTDPLKDVEPARIEHWKKLGYTKQMMIDESKYVTRPLRNR